MFGFGATGQFAIGEGGIDTAETFSPDKWYVALGQPVRSFPRSPAALSPFFFVQIPQEQFEEIDWLVALSEPPRFRPGIAVARQQFETHDTTLNPNAATLIQGWYVPLHGPVRFLQGTGPRFQQALGMPVRLLPKVNVTATLLAKETNTDAAIIAVNVVQSSPAGTGSPSVAVSLTETSSSGSATSVVGN